MRRKPMPKAWNHVLSAAAVAAMLATLPEGHAQGEKLGKVKIMNDTGPVMWQVDDRNDPGITMRVDCAGQSRDLAAGEDGSCSATSVSVTPVGPIASKVRMRVSSGRYLDKPTGSFTAGTVTFPTAPNNPNCDGRAAADVFIGGRLDDRSLTDMQVLQDGLWNVTIKHRCR